MFWFGLVSIKPDSLITKEKGFLEKHRYPISFLHVYRHFDIKAEDLKISFLSKTVYKVGGQTWAYQGTERLKHIYHVLENKNMCDTFYKILLQALK